MIYAHVCEHMHTYIHTPGTPRLPQVLTPADEVHHINKHNFKVPFVCGCRDLGEALRRIAEGAAMIRTKVGGCVGMAWVQDGGWFVCMDWIQARRAGRGGCSAGQWAPQALSVLHQACLALPP